MEKREPRREFITKAVTAAAGLSFGIPAPEAAVFSEGGEVANNINLTKRLFEKTNHIGNQPKLAAWLDNFVDG